MGYGAAAGAVTFIQANPYILLIVHIYKHGHQIVKNPFVQSVHGCQSVPGTYFGSTAYVAVGTEGSDVDFNWLPEYRFLDPQ